MNDDGNGVFIDLGDKGEYKYNAVCDLENVILDVKGLKEKKSKIYIALASDVLTKMTDEKLAATPAPTATPETDVFVPGGYWEVGIDIPAGAYSVRNPKNIDSQNFVIFEKYNEESGRYTRTIVNTILNSKTNSIIGKVTLREGNVVEVYDGVYLDEPVTLGF